MARSATSPGDARARETSPPPGAFDPLALRELSDGMASEEAAFLRILLQANIADLQQLRAHLSSGALAEAARCAHRIDGAARIIRAAEVSGDCRAVALAARAGDGGATAAALASLVSSLQRLNEAIERYPDG
ncbi:MAG: Hpt domain-containing protein [Variovorax sp.]|nr:Hpt domain-containing protein [Variovorax sp.]